MGKEKRWFFSAAGGVTPVALRAPSVTPPATTHPWAVHLKKRGKWSWQTRPPYSPRLRSGNGETVEIVPKTLNQNTEVVRFWPLFHCSNIPLFHVAGTKKDAIKNPLFQQVVECPRRCSWPLPLTGWDFPKGISLSTSSQFGTLPDGLHTLSSAQQ